MQKETDEQVAIGMVERAKERFSGMNSISYDKGYYSHQNRKRLCEILSNVALPKKGKLSKKDKEIQNSKSYRYAKQKHSAIESAINALDVHGLDKWGTAIRRDTWTISYFFEEYKNRGLFH